MILRFIDIDTLKRLPLCHLKTLMAGALSPEGWMGVQLEVPSLAQNMWMEERPLLSPPQRRLWDMLDAILYGREPVWTEAHVVRQGTRIRQRLPLEALGYHQWRRR